ASQLEGHLIPGRRRFRTDRHPSARRPWRASIHQLGTGPGAVAIEEVIISNLDQTSRSIGFDHGGRKRTNEAVLVAAAVVVISGDHAAGTDALNVGRGGTGNVDRGDDAMIVEEAMNMAGAVDVVSDDFAGAIDGFGADAHGARNADVGDDAVVVD